MTTWSIEHVQTLKNRDIYGVFKLVGNQRIRLGFSAESPDELMRKLYSVWRPGDVVKLPYATLVVQSRPVSVSKRGN